MNKKWLVLDCNYLCHRAKHSTGGLSYGGTPTGVIFGFLKTISHFQELFDTPHVIFCWDSKTNKREGIFRAYKRKRKLRYKDCTEEEARFNHEFRIQMQKLRRVYLKKIGYRNVFCQKGFESDDLIASICQGLPIHEEAVIISSDQDLYQLIFHNVSFFNPQKNKTLTLQGFTKQYRILPDQWARVKAIAGCATDEVPGIPGVGVKTVIKWMKGELKETTKAWWDIHSIKYKGLVCRNMKLVWLPLEGTKSFKLREDKPSIKGWREVTKELGMKSIRGRAPFSRQKKRSRNGKRVLV